MTYKNKKTYFEFMRILAIALVIFNHLPGYSLYQISSGPKQWFYMALTMITRINVPLFFMISGALLLKKDEDFKEVLKRRLPRFLLLLLIFEAALFFCYKIKAFYQGEDYDFSVNRFVLGFLAGDLDGTISYWYLYSYLGILLTLPFMQRIAKGIKKVDFWVLVILHGIFSSLIPMINILLSISNNDTIYIYSSFSIPFATTKAFFYPIIGYYLEEKIDVSKFKIKEILSMIAIGVCGIVLSCICTYWEGSTTGTFTQNYVQLFDYVTAIVVFVLIKYIFCKKFSILSREKIKCIICYVGSLTLGIYLLDPFLSLFLRNKYQNASEPFLPMLTVSIGWVFISMIMGGTITVILKRIPFIRKIL